MPMALYTPASNLRDTSLILPGTFTGTVQAIATCGTGTITSIVTTRSPTGIGYYTPTSTATTSTIGFPTVIHNGSQVYYTTTTTASSTMGTSLSYWVTGGGYTGYREEDAAKRSKARAREQDQKVSHAKAAIKRALKLMDNVGFGNDVRVFLGGDTVEVSHPESLFKFLLNKHRSSLIHRTHTPGHSTPYKLELYTKTDVHVANLCVYMEDTPMLDQVLALAMFIRSGDENYILERANWSCVVDDPVLREAISINNPELTHKVNRLSYRH